MSHTIQDVTSYNAGFITTEEGNVLFEQLMQYPKLTNMVEIELPGGNKMEYDFGKMMFLDEALIQKNALPTSAWGNTMVWSEPMLAIKKRIENHVKHKFSVCVCIYYPDGNAGVDFHSDEVAFGNTDIIPSISLGEEREFCLREKKTREVHSFQLKHGSLLTMGPGCQQYYEHSLPIDPKYLKPRINLTFRKYGF